MKRVLLKMEHYKPRLFFVIGLLFAVPFILGSGCSTDADSEEEAPTELVGYYEAIEFAGIGDQDGTVDILAEGGFVHLQLHNDFTLEGEIVIPEGTSFPSQNKAFNGTFNVSSSIDTLSMEHTDTPLDQLSPLLIKETNGRFRLASEKQPKPNRGDQYITLEKQNTEG